MLTNNQLSKLSTHVRSKIIALYDPASLFAPEEGLKQDLQMKHKGFYIGVVSSDGKQLFHDGFLKEDLNYVIDSADIVSKNVYSELKSLNIDADQIKKSTFYFELVMDCIYMPDPLSWDENRDGVYFMWGQKYRGMYLPYQIRRMNVPKVEILDRLCSWVCGVPSSLWRLPEGLVFKLICQSHVA